MRRTLMILTLLSVSAFITGCGGERPTAVTNASTNSANANNTGTGATAGTGPHTEGIGGNTENGAVSGNTYTAPPGFNKNGDKGSSTSVGNANKP